MHLIMGKIVDKGADFVEVDPTDLVSLQGSIDPDDSLVSDQEEFANEAA